MECQIQLPVVRVEKRFFLLNRTDKDTWGLVSSVTVEDGMHIVTLRSILQVCQVLFKLFLSIHAFISRFKTTLTAQLMYIT